jgi:hypothetical protein
VAGNFTTFYKETAKIPGNVRPIGRKGLKPIKNSSYICSLQNFWNQIKGTITKIMIAGGPSLTVLDTKSQNIPKVVVVRCGAGGVLGSWGGGGSTG